MKKNILFILLFVLGMFLERHLYEIKKFSQFDLSIFSSCCLITFLFCKKISNTIYNFISNSKDRINLIFTIIFFIVLCIPLSHISKETKSVSENRNLAEYPKFKTNTNFNLKFGEQFNSWLSDHFYLRDSVIRLHSATTKFLEKKKIQNERMFLGKDGWLFYKGDNSIQNFQNKSVYTNDDLENIAKYLTDINEWCKKNSKYFYYFIAPDKHRIYGEFYKYYKKEKSDSENRTFKLIDYLQKNTDIKVIYPYSELINQKQSGFTYYKNDTHWNFFGSYIGYQKLMTTIQSDLKIKNIVIKDWTMKKNRIGDLTNMYFGLDADNVTEYKTPKNLTSSLKCSKIKQEKDEQICSNKNKNLNVFMLRDSFTSALQIYLNETFKTIKYSWKYKISSEDLDYIKHNADIVILEQVERLVPSIIDNTFPKEKM